MAGQVSMPKLPTLPSIPTASSTGIIPRRRYVLSTAAQCHGISSSVLSTTFVLRCVCRAVSSLSNGHRAAVELLVFLQRNALTRLSLVHRFPSSCFSLGDTSMNSNALKSTLCIIAILLAADASHAMQLPDAFDWRDHGAVTGVKDEGLCSGSWAFSAAEVVEGQWFLAGHPLESLSAQELISCDSDRNTGGCDGGNPLHGLQSMLSRTNGTLRSASTYPFNSSEGKAPRCNGSLLHPKGASASAHFSSWLIIDQFNETAMAHSLVNNGPIGVCMQGDPMFLSYRGGVITHCPNPTFHLSHCGLLVGYNMTTTPPSWTIKSSFGVHWGEKGYMKLAWGNNTCHIAERPFTVSI